MMDEPMRNEIEEEELPEFEVDSKMLPEIEQWEIGGSYSMRIEVVQTSKEKEIFGDKNGKKKTTAEFIIRSIKLL